MAGEKLTTKEGRECPGYLNAGGSAARGAVVVIHEYWGLNAHIRDVTDRIATAGFTAFAPDLYGGKVATDQAGASELLGQLDWAKVAKQLEEAVHALESRKTGTRVGILGFCLGGGVALFAASRIPALSACVPFYGVGSRLDAAKIRARVLGHFANVDDWCTPERVNALEKQLADAGVDAQIHRYDAQHAFFNDTRPVYSAENAQKAWERTVAFLRETLA